MAFLALTTAASCRAPFNPASLSRRRSALPTVVRATANSNSASPHPILSSLRLAASAAVLLAATSPALACTPSPPTPAPAELTVTASPEDPVPEPDDDDSRSFEELIAETAALVRFGGADLARARLSSASPGARDSCARLLAAQTLFVDGKVEEAIAAFEELALEDPADYRPLFCQGMLYFALGRTEESVSALVRCREVAGDKFDLDFPKDLSPSPADAAVAEEESGADKVEAEAEEAKV